MSLYAWYGNALVQETLPKGHGIYNFGRSFLGHHYFILSMFDLILWTEKKIFKEIMHFHYMTYDIIMTYDNFLAK